MNSRRDFIKTGIVFGASACVLSQIVKAEAAEAAPAEGKSSPAELPVTPKPGTPGPLLVAVRDGSRAEMLQKALHEMGGIETFVKKGQSVVIKPNIGWNAPPERSSNTHPELVAAMVTLCLQAGASKVLVFDKTCDKWTDCYDRSGIQAAVKAAGGEMLPGNDESYYRDIALPNGIALKKASVHKAILESDVFINMPVLKHHSGSLMSASMKNLMGVVWDRGFYHKENLHQCIADFVSYRKPDLNVLDAYQPMFRNGPRGKTVEDTVEKRMLFASRDIVAIDTAGARVLDFEPSRVTHVVMANRMGLGTMDLSLVDVRRFSLAKA